MNYINCRHYSGGGGCTHPNNDRCTVFHGFAVSCELYVPFIAENRCGMTHVDRPRRRRDDRAAA